MLFVGQVSGIVENFNIRINSNTIMVINVKLRIKVLLIEFSPAQIIFSLPRISLAVEFTSACSLFMMVRDVNLPQLGKFPTNWNLQLFEVKLESCVFWIAGCCLLFAFLLLLLLFCFFQTTVEGHYQQVVAISNVCSWTTFVFWQCSLLIRRASSLNCDQSVCGVVYLGYARSIFWLLCDDQKCSPRQNC